MATVYSASNRLVKLVEEMYDNGNVKVLTRTAQYIYDANGNQLSEYTGFAHPNNSNYRRTIMASAYGDSQQTAPDPLIDRTLNTYDGFNRLTKVEKVEAGVRTIAEYVYNGDDLRVRKTVRKSDSSYTPEVTSFLYDRQHVIVETDANNTVKTRYIRGVNYIAQYSNGTSLVYFLYNGHGDTVQTVTVEGEVQNQYDYDIFGNPTLTIETAACSIRYAGEYLDNETGLYYLRARYYDPNIGRFISEDSYWGEDSNPLSLNLYTYAYNNPLRFIDPTGHAPQEQSEQDQIITLMAQIDALKKFWADEEKGAGKDQSKPTENQTGAHNEAEKIRTELLRLESGNPELQQLIKDDQKGKVGAWEQYTVVKTVQDMYDDDIFNPSKAKLLFERAKDYIISTNLGVSIYGIDKNDITKESMTQIEKAAREFVQGEIKSIIMAKLKQAWDNPAKEADKVTEYITDIIEKDYITDGSPQFTQFMYKMLKFNGIRHIATGVMAVDYVKGVKELVKFLDEADQRHSSNGMLMSGALSALKSGGDIKKFFEYFIEDQFGPDWEMIKGIVTGTIDDFKTVLDKEKAYKFFLDPDAKPSEISAYGESAINVAGTALIVGKLTTTAAKAGITAAKGIKLKPGAVVLGEGTLKSVGKGPFKAGEMFESSFKTKNGVEIGGLADVEINGTSLTLKDVSVYSNQGNIPNAVGARDIFQWQKQVSQMAKEQGFTELKIQGVRVPGSTSANPGKVVDYTIDLTKLK